MGPPTATKNEPLTKGSNWMLLKRRSIDHLLELLQRERPHGFRRWLRFEYARLFREWIHTFTCFFCGRLLQLTIQNTAQLEGTVRLDLGGYQLHIRIQSTFHVLRF